MIAPAILTDQLTKDYGGGRGLFQLDLQVDRQIIFGFLGPNGAGKTTMIRLLMDMIRPSSGSVSLLGMDARRESVAIKKRVGYVPGELPDFGGLTGGEMVAATTGLRRGVDPQRVRDLAEQFDVDLHVPYRRYSRGNKQKLAILLAFMHRPELLILDEPTSGLDPLHQQTFYALVREARAAGASVFLSSHVLAEVDQICDRVGIIRAGRLVKVSDLADLRGIRIRRVTIEFGRPVPIDALTAAGLEDAVSQGSRVTGVVRDGFARFLSTLNGMPVLDLVSEEPSLEEVFLTYYQDAGDDAHAAA